MNDLNVQLDTCLCVSGLCLSLEQDVLCLINMDDDHVPEHPDSSKSGTAF